MTLWDLPTVLLLGIAEAAWVSLVFSAITGTTRQWFLALVVPLILAAVVARMIATPHWRHRRTRQLVLLTAGLGGAAASTAVLWQVWRHAVGWAIAVAVVASLRGTWLGRRPPEPRSAVISMSLGAAAFVLVFVAQAASPSHAFAASTHVAGWLLFVYFFAGFAALAWAHEHQLERSLLRRSNHAPSGAWFAGLGVPLSIVAALSLLVGFAAGVTGRPVAHALVDVGSGIVLAVQWLFEKVPRVWWAHLFRALTQFFDRLTGLSHATAHGSHAGRAPHANPVAVAIGIVLDAVVVAATLFAVGKLAWWLIQRALGHRGLSPERVPEERESIFTWSHFFGQLRRALANAFRRGARRRREVPASIARRAAHETDPVRAAYLGFLVAARAARLGRAPWETPLELEARLEKDLPLAPLGDLTESYNLVRYAEEDAAALADDARAAAVLAVSLLPVSARAPEHEGP